jgi:hypothetical protein
MAATHSGTFVRCSWRSNDQGRSYHYDGTQRGVVGCVKPFGSGRESGVYEDRVTGPTATENASIRLSFRMGAIRGKLHLSGTFSTTRYHGTYRITRGTGQFRHVTGTLRLSCRSTVPTTVCSASGVLGGI